MLPQKNSKNDPRPCQHQPASKFAAARWRASGSAMMCDDWWWERPAAPSIAHKLYILWCYFTVSFCNAPFSAAICEGSVYTPKKNMYYMHTHTHIYIYLNMENKKMNKLKNININKYIYTQIHIFIHTYIHTYVHIYISLSLC